MTKYVLVAFCVFCGCSSSSGLRTTGDGGTGFDLAFGAHDMSGTTQGDAATSGEVTMAHGSTYKFVISRVLLPQSRSDDAIDLNGDGRVDNQLGNIVAALASQGVDPQTLEDQAVTSGQALELVAVQTADPSFQQDSAVGATISVAQQQSNPNLSGGGTFTVDGAYAPGTVYGKLAQGTFSSNNPVTTRIPATIYVPITFGFGAPVVVPLRGSYARFTGGTGGLSNGQLDGSIKQSDVQNLLIPGIATSLTRSVQSDPTSSQSQQIESIFDTGGCTNPQPNAQCSSAQGCNGQAAQASDETISVCEVSQNAIIQNLLAPDVQIYDANGNYAPNPNNTNKDSLSVGLGFTAVPASF